MDKIIQILSNKDYYSILKCISQGDDTSLLISEKLKIKKPNLSHKTKYMKDANLMSGGEKNSKYRIEPILINWNTIALLFFDYLKAKLKIFSVNNRIFSKEITEYKKDVINYSLFFEKITEYKKDVINYSPIFKKIIEGFFEYGLDIFCLRDLFDLLIDNDLDLLEKEKEEINNKYVKNLVSLSWICSPQIKIGYRIVKGELFGIHF